MSVTLADAIINILPDDSKVGGVFGRVRGMTNTLVTGIGLGIGNAIATGIGRVASSVGDLVGEMVSGNAQFEQYNTQFEVLLGSAEAAEERMADLAEFGAKTPFELPEVVEADRILQGFGLHAEDVAEQFGFAGEEIRTIAGDVASGTGSSFQEMALLIGKFSAGATGEAIARMSELGITNRKELAELGLEFSKSGELLSPLPEAMETILTLMEDKYGGLMDAQSGTFNGMLSNLQDWKSATLRRIGEPIFELLKDKLGTVLEFLGSPEVMAAIDGFGNTLANGIGQAVDWINNSLLPAFQTAASFILTNVIPAISSIYEIIRFLITGDFRGGIFGWFEDDDRITALFDLRDGLIQLWGTIQNGIAQITPFITQFFSWKDVLIALGVVIAAAIIPAIGSLIAGIVAVAAPIIAIIAVIALLRNAWENDWGGIRTFILELAPQIQEIIQTFLTFIQTLWQEHGAAILATISGLWELLSGYFSTNLEALKEMVRAFIALFQGDWEGFANHLYNSFRLQIEALVDFFGGLWDMIAPLLAHMVLNLIAYLQGVDWAGIGTNIIQGIANGITAAAGFIADAARAAAQAALDAAKDLLGIDSPSKVMAMEVGMPTAAGIAQGLQMGLPQIEKSAASIGDALEGLFSRSMGMAMAGAGVGSQSFTSQDNFQFNVGNARDAELAARLVARQRSRQIRDFKDR